jgi:hypothetical protein
MDEERLPQKILNLIPTEKRKRGRQRTVWKEGISKLWKNVVYKMETGRTDFIGGWVSKYVIAQLHAYIEDTAF